MQPDTVIVDTDVFSWLMRGHQRAKNFLPHLTDRVPAICFTTVGELYFGAHKDSWGERKLAQLEQSIRRYAVLPWDANLAKLWGQLLVKARAAASPLGQREHTNDLWIATCAVYYEAPLLTGNRRHMKDLPELKFADD